MTNNDNKFLSTRTALMATAGLGIFMVIVKRERLWSYIKNLRNPLRHRTIEIIQNAEDCQRVVARLKKHCDNYNVLGFDCEWVTVGGTRRPTALLQLSSSEGLCALFRLCCMKQIPKSLRDLLEDDEVIKVGVASQGDAQKLAHDFGVGVASTFDLRFLAAITGTKPEGLAKLSKAVLNVELDKNWRLVCSDWEAKELNTKQINYAANDAMVAIEIFKRLAKAMEPKNFWNIQKRDLKTLLSKLEPFFEVNYKDSIMANVTKRSKDGIVVGLPKVKKTALNASKKGQVRFISTRSKALYDNCLLEAPDGELLCTIDRKKAKWYMEQNLGTEVKVEPYTVRLNFEPAGRAVGEVGKYYQTPKENQCVVCGHKEAFIRKNVVPREYRKHFPVVMKSHSSHDVVLLCPMCHQLSNISDLKVRHKLGKLCDAPFTYEEGAVKFIEIPELKKVKSAGGALLKNSDQIPIERRKHLEEIILNYFKEESVITADLLQEAADINPKESNSNYCQHGEKVVTKFQTELGGLIELERIWREHFLHTMEPKYLPALWNVNHNADRLEIRANEGRIDKEDLKIAGLEPQESYC